MSDTEDPFIGWLAVFVGAFFVIVLLVVFDLSGQDRVSRLSSAVSVPEAAVVSSDSSQSWEVVKDLPVWLEKNRDRHIDSITGMGDGCYGYDDSYFVAYSVGVVQYREVIKASDFSDWVLNNRGKRRIVSVCSIGEGVKGSVIAYLVVSE